MDTVNLVERFGSFDEYWSPKIVGRVNDYDVKLAKLKGEFVRHTHDDTDELFLVVRGAMTIKLPERDVRLSEGEMFIVPRGVAHLPVAEDEAHVLLFEPRGTVNTGEVVDARATIGEERW
jgi:mannose-6-phosphate isomerase-like protein (cupin superfamily)